MTKRPTFSWIGSNIFDETDFTCPHCGVFQAITVNVVDVAIVKMLVRHCRNCKDATITYYLGLTIQFRGMQQYEPCKSLYPATAQRPPMSFVAAPEEAETAYREACSLSAVHTGAAGAYARRALELLLDNMGYTAKTLADSIKLVAKESDPDKRLPRSLLTQLDYIREIGNFALHVRRDGELAIVEISDAEVATCLEAIEELIAHWYVGPVEQYLKVQALNNKLQSAGKPAIGLPLLPPGIDPAIISPPPSPPEGESASSPPEVEDAPSSTSLTSK